MTKSFFKGITGVQLLAKSCNVANELQKPLRFIISRILSRAFFW